MEDSPATVGAPRPARRRLLWTLVALAALSSGAAAFAWNRGQETQPDLPEVVSLEQLDAVVLDATEPAPDFTVPTVGGDNFSLYEHFATEGTPVVLNLWASWCPPCRAEMPAFDAAAARHPNVKFVGVAVQDDPRAAEEFAEEIGVSYTIGLDEREEVNALYPTFGLPVTYLISPQGIILQKVIAEIDEGQIDALIATWFGG